MKKRILALFFVIALAFTVMPFTAFADGEVQESNDISLEFTESTDAENFNTFVAPGYDCGGWQIVEKIGDYVFSPVQEGAINNSSMIEYKNPIVKSETKYISFDFYAVANRFDIVFLDTNAINQWGNAKSVHIHSWLTLAGNVDMNNWIADFANGNYVDGKPHNIKFAIVDGSFSVYVDNNLIDWGNGKTTEELPAETCKLLIRAVGQKSYIDNFKVSDSDIVYKAPAVLVDPYDEATIDFSKGADVTQYFTEKVGGWKADGGWFYPNNAYAQTYLTQPIDMSGEKYVAFDFYIAKNNDGATNTQFNVALINDIENDGCTVCLHGIMNGDRTVFTANSTLGSLEKAKITCDVDWDDGYEHNLKIIIKEEKISFAIDGEMLKTDKDEVYYVAIGETELLNGTYLVLQASNSLCYVDNVVISNTDITYTAPESYGEFEEFTKTFDTTDADVKQARGSGANWKVVDGKLSATSAWNVAYIDKKIPLNQDKTITLNFSASDEAGHQFIVSLKKNPNHQTESGLPCTKGMAIHFYNGQVLLSYNAGSPLGEVATAIANTNYCDGVEHTLKIIVRNFKAYVLIDDVVLFRGLYLGAGYGYLTLQSTNTTDYIDNLMVKNVADAISVPNVEGDTASGNVPVQKPNASGLETTLEKGGCGSEFGSEFILLSLTTITIAIVYFALKKKA